MTRPLQIAIAQRARRQITDLEGWWRTNRSAARGAVQQELTRVFRLLGRQPRAGSCALDGDLTEVRRIHMSKLRHYLYYRILDSDGAIEVLAVWSDSRGEGPPI